jgi:hypothetical protein
LPHLILDFIGNFMTSSSIVPLNEFLDSNTDSIIPKSYTYKDAGSKKSVGQLFDCHRLFIEGAFQPSIFRMRLSPAYVSLLLLPISALQIPSILAPFYEPHLDDSVLISNETIIPPTENELRKRDGNCPINYNSCSTLAKADAGACCTAGSICTLDHARNIACCPIGATCTGTIQIATGTAASTTGTGGSSVIFGASTTASTTTVTSTNTVATAMITGTVSYVPNAYFPFPYIPTTYANSAACNSAYSDCQTNYAACTVDLQGGSGNGVTIVAPGGGITVAATSINLGVASATSICSSLSSAACYGLIPQNCPQFGTAFIVSTTTNGMPRQTVGCLGKVVWAGVGLGIAGQMV